MYFGRVAVLCICCVLAVLLADTAAASPSPAPCVSKQVTLHVLAQGENQTAAIDFLATNLGSTKVGVTECTNAVGDSYRYQVPPAAITVTHHNCGSISATASTSCGLAQAVSQAVVAGIANTGAMVRSVVAHSPVTGLDYSFTCAALGAYVACDGSSAKSLGVNFTLSTAPAQPAG
jgi:hypothetical protein